MMDKLKKGFEIKCLECGKTSTFNRGDDTSEKKEVNAYSCGYGGEIGIGCDCGNSLEEGWNVWK